MTTSQNNIPDELLKSLESTTTLMKNLLDDIKDHSTSLAIVQAKLESLGGSVETLSHIVRDGNGRGSMVTRLVLIEKVTEDIEEHFDELKDEIKKDIDEIKRVIIKEKEEEKDDEEKVKAFKREKMLAKLKVIAVAAPGLLALVLLLIKMFLGTSAQ
ncbi:MAG TPA: hypothetical protein ENH99_00370 [Candidatus Pacearchaeota archaeon]|nr:hypothetical protein [Candidatus Pacearchaeota archaeon]